MPIPNIIDITVHQHLTKNVCGKNYNILISVGLHHHPASALQHSLTQLSVLVTSVRPVATYVAAAVTIQLMSGWLSLSRLKSPEMDVSHLLLLLLLLSCCLVETRRTAHDSADELSRRLAQVMSVLFSLRRCQGCSIRKIVFTFIF